MKWKDYQKAYKTTLEMQKSNNPSNVSVSSLFDKNNPFNRK